MLFFTPIAIHAAVPSHPLTMLEERAFQFFWHESNPSTGFTKDRATNFTSPDDHPVASSASVGFALCAYAIGTENHWVSRQQALTRTRLTLTQLETTYPKVHGWFYHFVDWKSGKRQWNCEVSSIDTSIMLAGVMAADDYWHDPAIHRLASKIEHGIDWNWMLTNGGAMPNETHLSMGWTPEHGFIKARWDSYCELTMLYIQGYGLDPDLPAAGWKTVKRPLATFDNITTVVGGPLFMHEMTDCFFDLKDKRDVVGMDYWLTSLYAAKIQKQYAIENPKHFTDYGAGFWGLSACDTPDGYQALGFPNSEDDGTVTPTSAIATVQFDEAMGRSVANALLQHHSDALGRYGFSNGINPTRKWNGPDVIGIDLGMMMLGIDAVHGGLIHRLLLADPITQLGMKRMGFHPEPSVVGDPPIVTQLED